MKLSPALILILLIASGIHPRIAAAEVGDASPSPMRCSNAADDRALRQIAEDWRRAYNNGKAAAVAALYTEDAYYLTQHFATGIIHGRPAIQAYVQLGINADYHVDSIKVLATSCSANFAYTLTRYRSTNAGQQAMGVNLVVLHKIRGRWRIVAHESAVPDPATAIKYLGVSSDR